MLKTAMKRTDGVSHWKRLGKVKLGLKKRGKMTCALPGHQHVEDCFSHYPVDVKYFVIPEEFKEKLGPEPQKLSIMLAFPTLQQNFDVKAALYRANGTKWCHTDDDVTAKRLFKVQVPDPKNAGRQIDKTVYKTIDCPNTACEFRISGQCPPRGGLEFMVPGIYPAVGTLFLKVGSQIAQDQMLATLRGLEEYCMKRENGMQGIYMELERVQMFFHIDKNGDGTLSKIEKWIPKLSIDYERLQAGDKKLLGLAIGQQFTVPDVVTADQVSTDDEEPVILDQNPITA